MSKKKGSKEKVLPRLKKNISSFTKGEKGQISKQSMLTVGAIVGGAAIGAAISLKAVKGRPYVITSHGTSSSSSSANYSHEEEISPSLTVQHTKTGLIKITHSHHYSY